jgi:uncharacterized protein YdiU (UPF0061 family)
MSEDRSVSPATESKTSKKTAATLINTNAVLQKALQKIIAEDRGSIILRCDELPSVRGTEDDFETVFSTLVQMILQKKNDVSKLFLHINCTAEDEQATAAGVKPFNIQFNTNISPSVNWLQLHQQQINEVAAILHKHTGSLVVNQVKNGGCIFSVSLLGKSM